MKIKTRKELLIQYKEECLHIPLDDTKRMNWFLSTLGSRKDKVLSRSKELALKIISNRGYKTVKITLCEFPMKTDRGRHVHGRVWSPNAALNKKYLGDAIRQLKKEFRLINTPAKLDIQTYLQMPKGIKDHEQILYELRLLCVAAKPDHDNISKCYSDMMSEVLTIDDDIFYDARLRKWYSWLPRVEIIIKFQKCHESEYLYNKIKKRDIVKTLLAEGLIDVELL